MLSDELIHSWMEAVERGGNSSVTRAGVRRAGEFLLHTAQLDRESLERCLIEIDYSFAVIVVRLPMSVYVRNEGHDLPFWYTDTGFSPQQFRAVRTPRSRPFFIPAGVVPALRLTTRLGPVDCRPAALLAELPPAMRRSLDEQTHSTGQQFFVHGTHQMKQL